MDAEHNRIPRPDFERWLDAALRARVETEPSPVLERRVLARLATTPTRTHFVWWTAFAASAALLAVVFGTILMRTAKPTPTAVTRPGQAESPLGSYRKPTIRASVVPRESRRPRTRAGAKVTHCCGVLASTGVNNSKPLPKLAVFPTPRPETEQEHLLFCLAAQQGSIDTASLNRELPIRELLVPELNIPPMGETPPDNIPQH